MGRSVPAHSLHARQALPRRTLGRTVVPVVAAGIVNIISRRKRPHRDQSNSDQESNLAEFFAMNLHVVIQPFDNCQTWREGASARGFSGNKFFTSVITITLTAERNPLYWPKVQFRVSTMYTGAHVREKEVGEKLTERTPRIVRLYILIW